MSEFDLFCDASVSKITQTMNRYYGLCEIVSLGNKPAGNLTVQPCSINPVGVLNLRRMEFRRRDGEGIWLDHYFFLVQLTGYSVIRQHGRTAALYAGDMIIGSGSEQSSLAVPEYGSIAAIHLSHQQMELIGLDHLSCKIDSSKKSSKMLLSLATCMIEATKYNDDRTFSDALAIAIRLLRQTYEDLPSKNRVENAYLTALQHWVLGRTDDRIDPQAMATHLGISKRQLYRIFKERDLTPETWLTDIRLARAYELLIQSPRLTITEIAFMTGFGDSSHFAKSFRRRYGRPPRAARRSELA